ncbi:MAG: hypothetical protein ACLUHA_00680 [Bacteroides stercoris]
MNLSGNRGRLGDFIDGVDIFYVTDAQVGWQPKPAQYPMAVIFWD